MKRRTIIIYIIVFLIVIFFWWFIGGEYLSYDSSDERIKKRITFSEDMKEVSPIPELYAGIKIRKKYQRVLIPNSSQFWNKSLPSTMEVKLIPIGMQFYISNIIYLKTYGFLTPAFKTNVFYYVVQDSEGKKYIFYGGRGYELIK